jgi:hypothetical protein
MTIRWFSDADRQAMRESERDHEELLQVYEELRWKYDPPKTMTDGDRAEAIEQYKRFSQMSSLKIDPTRRD